MSRQGEFTRIGSDEELQARIKAFTDRGVKQAVEDESTHRARMATLPLDACDYCYGRGCYRCADRPAAGAPGVPHEFVSSSLESYRKEPWNGKAIAAARGFTEHERDLYLFGGVGSGKTRLACSIANAWYAKPGHTALFVRVPMALHALAPGRNEDEREEYERRLFAVRLLVLDDVGAERDVATDYTRRTLMMVYEERGDRGLRTIWTSNKGLDELGQMQADDRLASRIAGRADVVALSGPDQRLHRPRLVK